MKRSEITDKKKYYLYILCWHPHFISKVAFLRVKKKKVAFFEIQFCFAFKASWRNNVLYIRKKRDLANVAYKIAISFLFIKSPEY